MKATIISAVIAVASHFCFGQHDTNKKITMKQIDQVYTVYITNKLNETVTFYEQYFGFTRLFESTFFVMLQTPGQQKFAIAFMSEDHPTAPPTPKAFTGNGSFLTLEVSNAKGVYEDLKKQGLSIAYALKNEPWGQTRFGVIDPNNLWIDVVQQTQPEEGFWDNYIK